MVPHRIAVALCVGWSWASAAAETTVRFDPARTTIEFTLADVLHTVHGTFKLKSGLIQYDPATGKARGSLVIDATSGDSGSAARNRRMHASILESRRYPEIAFTPDRVSGNVALDGASNVQVHGQFRIHGADHELTLPFALRTGAGFVTAATQFLVPYVRWGMKNPSTFLLKVNDAVEINIRTTGVLEH